ncbi:restriction endonuclease subunit S [Plantibacter cousiniae (nom. nud.)]|uniref:Type I restriction enzyme, S subunit n=1 Tax=Plantibacter cousiniae (nom. nud.) TaxID=199709 RepID=A0ABY1LNF8_9MICO|nr:restriction endonuclease subunit S [Plantibacter cousiniae]SKC68311.1 type I restriction enzyme, S subunit [Plantibacter cousiniae]
MSHLEQMIAELCPDGVELKALGGIGEFVRGNGLQKSDLTDAGVPAIHYGQLHTYYGVWAEVTKSFTDPALAARLRRAKPGDLVIATTSEDDAAVGRATAWLGQDEVAVSGDAYIYRHTLDARYVAYFFQSARFQEQKVRHITGTKVRRISGDALAKIRIPVPPLEVQCEIVRILDQFTQLKAELEAELEAELQARRRQYSVYRNALVAAVEGPRVPLGELGTFARGRRFTKGDVVESGIPSIHYGEIYTDYGVSATRAKREVNSELLAQLRFAQPSDVIFAGVGETVIDVGKAVAWLGDGPVAVHDDTFSFTSGLDPKYVAYAVQTDDFHAQKANHVASGKVKRLSSAGLSKIKIPVPSAEEQIHIVAILDSFDTIINDLSLGLPAELVARREQYEYYRDRLLTFEEAVV